MTKKKLMQPSVKHVSILGTEYEIRLLDGKDEYMKTGNKLGYCDCEAKCISVDVKDYTAELSCTKNLRSCQESTVRHELVHAFFFESGLDNYSYDETLIDWIATQIPKMVTATKEVGAL